MCTALQSMEVCRCIPPPRTPAVRNRSAARGSVPQVYDRSADRDVRIPLAGAEGEHRYRRENDAFLSTSRDVERVGAPCLFRPRQGANIVRVKP